MLADQEYVAIAASFQSSIRSVKSHRIETGVSLKTPSVAERFEPESKNEAMPGYRETNENAIMHHRLSLYGPPCKRLRQTPANSPRKALRNCMPPVQPE